jgi:hypothetical protein
MNLLILEQHVPAGWAVAPNGKHTGSNQEWHMLYVGYMEHYRKEDKERRECKRCGSYMKKSV